MFSKSTLRAALASLLLLPAGGLLSGCGKTNPAATSPVPSPPTVSTPKSANRAGEAKPPKPSPTRSQASAFARAVNLTAADLPGFVAADTGSEGSDAREKRLEHKMTLCVHPSSSKALFEASSHEFELQAGGRAESVSSEVTIAPTAATAAAELGVIRSGRASSCVSRYLNQLVAGRFPGADASPVSIRQGTPPAPGTTGGFGWRIAVPLSVRDVHLTIYLDVLGFVDGVAEVTLMSVGSPEPFPAATEERLYSLLLARAKSHRA